MNRALFFVIVLGYLLAPYMYTWLADPNGAWYRPFVVWSFAIVALSVMSGRLKDDH